MVAHAAGVSTGTVSRTLNGSTSVSEAKRQAVLEAVRHLGFRPNPVARGLAGGRTLSIGVVTPTITSPFYGEALGGVEQELATNGYMLLFASDRWSEAGARQALAALVGRCVDALIVLAGLLPNSVLASYAQHLPMVVVGRAAQEPGLFCIAFDNRTGARMATQHLIDGGHRRIAHITGNLDLEDGPLRQAGYRDALMAAGLACDPALVIEGNFTEDSGQRAVERMLATGLDFTAVFAGNDQMALAAALVLHRCGRRVPDDVSLVGFDDLAPAHFAIPPLTTIRQPAYLMGRQAAVAVMALLRGQEPQVQLPEPELVLRESTRTLQR